MTSERRHVALLVEDDPDIAADIGELLESIGHAYVHATNKEDAERLIEAGEFCYALLDLSIKATASAILPRTEAGERVRELLRERYPHRNEAGDHYLPILMVSAHSEPRHIIKAFHSRADDFITKPISENEPPFKDKIEVALRKAGREKHEHCGELMRRARAHVDVPAAGGAVLAITGVQQGKRFEVQVGTTLLTLTQRSLEILLRLVLGRLESSEGWVHRDELGARSDQGWKGISRLRDEVGRTDVEIESDKSGQYRLSANVAIGVVDTERLEALREAAISKIASKIRALRG